MSATVSDDSFLIKGLGLSPDVIDNPLMYSGETWSGEKMVLIPSLLDDGLTDQEIVHLFAKRVKDRKIGVVVLTPGFDYAKDWQSGGAVVATKEDIDAHVQSLRDGKRDATLVVANRYDGIDLPDDSCRVLIMDGKPHGTNLLDRYLEECRPGSELTNIRTARIIEQGLGRAVRGEKDYCVVILGGADLVRTVRQKELLTYLSEQTRTQIEVGMDVAEYAREDIGKGIRPRDALMSLIRQCLRRDEGWKEFYSERMNSISRSGVKPRMLDIIGAEFRAAQLFRAGDVDGAVSTLQELINRKINDTSDAGWYLQEMARYMYATARQEANTLQISAHRANRYLLKPRQGMIVTKLTTMGQERISNLIDWIKSFSSYEALSLVVNSVLTNLRFGVRAEHFERSLDELAAALGFVGERPDKEWKAGPDNMWLLRDGEYLLFECKSEVESTRAAIHKTESGQMNNSCAWFQKEYTGSTVTRIMIIPTKKLGAGAGFNEPVTIIRQAGLAKLTRNVASFFAEFRTLDLRNLSETKVNQLLESHGLGIAAIRTQYAEEPKPA